MEPTEGKPLEEVVQQPPSEGQELQHPAEAVVQAQPAADKGRKGLNSTTAAVDNDARASDVSVGGDVDSGYNNTQGGGGILFFGKVSIRFLLAATDSGLIIKIFSSLT